MAQELAVGDVIAITGHRDRYARSELIRGLDGLRGSRYVFGGARGVDTDALEYLGRTQNMAWRTVIVPNRVADQPAVARVAMEAWADEVIELRNTGPGRFQIRNRAMIDRADRLHAFYDFRGRGGTFNSMEYARSVGKPFSTTPVGAVDLSSVRASTEAEIWEYAQVLQENHVQRNNAKSILLMLLRAIGLKPSPQLKALFRSWRW